VAPRAAFKQRKQVNRRLEVKRGSFSPGGLHDFRGHPVPGGSLMLYDVGRRHGNSHIRRDSGLVMWLEIPRECLLI
jgi:hypothetical protein